MMRRSAALLVGAVVLLAGLASPATAAVAPAPVSGPCDSPREIIPVEITTVPAVPGLVIHLDGRPIQLSGSGTATPTTCRKALVTRLDVGKDPVQLDERRRVRFDRMFVMEAGARVALAFHVDFLTQVRLNGVEQEEVSSYTIRSSTGAEIESSGNDPLWLWGQRVVRGPAGLLQRNLFYSVQDVQVHGDNVVTRSQTKFFPAEDSVIEVPLLSYNVNLSVRDRLFGFPIGSAAHFEAADGTVLSVELQSGRGTLRGVPRGTYTLRVDAPGLDTPRPLSVSRDQEVALPVLSWLDVGVLAGIPALVGALLVLMPRPALRARLRRIVRTDLLGSRLRDIATRRRPEDSAMVKLGRWKEAPKRSARPPRHSDLTTPTLHSQGQGGALEEIAVDASAHSEPRASLPTS